MKARRLIALFCLLFGLNGLAATTATRPNIIIILADDMGLGKTLQVISLILADKALKRNAVGVSGATLILAPVSVMSNWSSQVCLRHFQI